MNLKKTTAWFVLGIVSFSVVPILLFCVPKYYAWKEPFFLSPLESPHSKLFLRNDSYGKGYFGAPRNGKRVHKGVDFLSAVGRPVLASKSGRVVVCAEEKGGYGKHIEIKHPSGFATIYAHLSSLLVKEGQWVSSEEPIGLIGKTGNAQSNRIRPHLHFEIMNQYSTPIDPLSGQMTPNLAVYNS